MILKFLSMRFPPPRRVRRAAPRAPATETYMCFCSRFKKKTGKKANKTLERFVFGKSEAVLGAFGAGLKNHLPRRTEKIGGGNPFIFLEKLAREPHSNLIFAVFVALHFGKFHKGTPH